MKEISSEGACLSAYNMLRSAEVHAPPALPAGSGSLNEATFETSAEVCLSAHPEIYRDKKEQEAMSEPIDLCV